MHSAASLVTKSFTYRKIQQEEMNGLLLKVLAQDGSSFNSVSKLIKKYLIFSNQHGNTFYLSPPKETKKELIKIYSDSLAGALKSSNIKKIKLAKKQYCSNKNWVVWILFLLRLLILSLSLFLILHFSEYRRSYEFTIFSNRFSLVPGLCIRNHE